MAYDTTLGIWKESDLMLRLKAEREAALALQIRKHEDWNDNYELCRNKVKTNRLTQRQAVNIPLMRETEKTLLSRIDDPPNVEWQELSGDEYKELIFQEVWADSFKRNNIELIDVIDKKNVLRYGLSSTKLNIVKDGVSMKILDPFDIIYDPLMDPSDVETARFWIHLNIFKSVREILASDRYKKEGKDNLKIWLESPPGIVQSKENKEMFEKKIERLKDMGINHSDFEKFAGGDRLVNISEHFTTQWNTKTKKFERRVVTYADMSVELSNESLKDLIGVDFWPIDMWAEDPETNDIYPDSIDDIVRTPNKIINVWFSQLVENRTLKNFRMHWFSPVQGYTPKTYTPGPGVMLPAPPGDDINKVIKPVEIDGLDDTLQAIGAITNIVERATAATAIEKGQPEKGTQTLGEVQILVGKASERTVAMAKFYRLAWYRRAWKWNKMMEANAPKFLKLYKQSRSGKVYPKRVYAGDWLSDAGYEPIVRSTSEQEQETTKGLQKFTFVLQQFPNNVALRKIAQKRMLEMVDLTPEELKQVQDAEAQAVAAVESGQESAPGQLQTEIQDRLGQLESLNAS